MYSKLTETLSKIKDFEIISTERKLILQPLIDFVQQKIDEKEIVNLNFICTHNSRRSHIAQVWAQVSAELYNIPKVNCYSGGTEETALFPKVVETLEKQGFKINKISETDNPIYIIKFDKNALPIIGFSKKHDHFYNPQSHFAALMMCSQADDGCPFISGAEQRLSITFEDPKISDNTPKQNEIYEKKSLEIAIEMHYVFSKIRL